MGSRKSMPAIVAVRGHHRMVSCRNGRSMLSPNICTSIGLLLDMLKISCNMFILKRNITMPHGLRLFILLNCLSFSTRQEPLLDELQAVLHNRQDRSIS